MSYLDERADLAGRVAVVVGGGGGIGRACAVDLSRAGMHLALADRDAAALDEVAAVIAEAEETVRAVLAREGRRVAHAGGSGYTSRQHGPCARQCPG